ncbi:MAG: PQQ-dependent sugar dehydrogenase [Actinomycetota bacterium]|nr:PQQ-dependent sugar dehydrogenase [Actinomycetota bacterium]
MQKKYFFLSLLILACLFLISCISVQEKPIISESNTSEEILFDKESITSTTKKIITPEPEETIKENEIDLKNLEDLENSFIVNNVFPSISFARPLEFQNAGDGSGRIFIVEQAGRILVITGKDANKADVFLDLKERVDDNGNEKGLLGLAFHPDFKENGQFFVNYTTENSTIVSRFLVSADNPDEAEPDSEEIIITFAQPYANHNGGKLAFSPVDRYLYIATGDGGGAGDPDKNSQNLGTLLGKILRIDIDNKESGLNYSIPRDNPFKGNREGYREEIYAYGLRNPWKFSFDSITGTLWAADVGQNKTEEIDIIQKGKNYGWNIMEGSYCYDPPEGCNPEGLELPVYEYQHPLGESITGGYVYNGEALDLLKGVYIYADFITGHIWGLVYTEGQAVSNFTLAKTDANISSFGTDENQELYFTAFDGRIYNLTLP